MPLHRGLQAFVANRGLYNYNISYFMQYHNDIVPKIDTGMFFLLAVDQSRRVYSETYQYIQGTSVRFAPTYNTISTK